MVSSSPPPAAAHRHGAPEAVLTPSPAYWPAAIVPRRLLSRGILLCYKGQGMPAVSREGALQERAERLTLADGLVCEFVRHHPRRLHAAEDLCCPVLVVRPRAHLQQRIEHRCRAGGGGSFVSWAGASGQAQQAGGVLGTAGSVAASAHAAALPFIHTPLLFNT